MSSYISRRGGGPKPVVGILLPKERRRQILRNKPKALRRTSYHQEVRETAKLCEDAQVIFKLGPRVTRNIIEYVRALVKPGGRDIDKNIFDAQMKRHFNITNLILLDRMFHVCCIDDSNCVVTTKDFVELMCIFLTEIRDLKVRYAFKVYNQLQGDLSRKDIASLIAPMVARVSIEDEDVSAEKEFVDMLVAVMDRNDDGSIDIDEFRKLVDEDIMMLQCLGTCLPSEEDRIKFLSLLCDRTAVDVQKLFRFERRICLKSDLLIPKGTIQKYYPVLLELP